MKKRILAFCMALAVMITAFQSVVLTPAAEEAAYAKSVNLPDYEAIAGTDGNTAVQLSTGYISGPGDAGYVIKTEDGSAVVSGTVVYSFPHVLKDVRFTTSFSDNPGFCGSAAFYGSVDGKKWIRLTTKRTVGGFYWSDGGCHSHLYDAVSLQETDRIRHLKIELNKGYVDAPGIRAIEYNEYPYHPVYLNTLDLSKGTIGTGLSFIRCSYGWYALQKSGAAADGDVIYALPDGLTDMEIETAEILTEGKGKFVFSASSDGTVWHRVSGLEKSMVSNEPCGYDANGRRFLYQGSVLPSKQYRYLKVSYLHETGKGLYPGLISIRYNNTEQFGTENPVLENAVYQAEYDVTVPASSTRLTPVSFAEGAEWQDAAAAGYSQAAGAYAFYHASQGWQRGAVSLYDIHTITDFNLDAYAETVGAAGNDLEITVSTDGRSWIPVATEREIFDSAHAEWGNSAGSHFFASLNGNRHIHYIQITFNANHSTVAFAPALLSVSYNYIEAEEETESQSSYYENTLEGGSEVWQASSPGGSLVNWWNCMGWGNAGGYGFRLNTAEDYFPSSFAAGMLTAELDHALTDYRFILCDDIWGDAVSGFYASADGENWIPLHPGKEAVENGRQADGQGIAEYAYFGKLRAEAGLKYIRVSFETRGRYCAGAPSLYSFDFNTVKTAENLETAFGLSGVSSVSKSDLGAIRYYLEHAVSPESESALRLELAAAYLENSSAETVDYAATAPVYEYTEMSTVNSGVQKFRYHINMKVLSVALPAVGAHHISYGTVYENRSVTREELLAVADHPDCTAETPVRGAVSDFNITVNRTNAEIGLRTSVLPYVRWTDKDGKTHVLYSDESVSKSPAGWLKSAIGVCLADKSSAAYIAYRSRLSQMSGTERYAGIDLAALFSEISGTVNQVQALAVLRERVPNADKDFYYGLLTDLFSFTYFADINGMATSTRLNDALNNLGKVYSYGGNLGIDSGNAAVFGDNDRIFRAGSEDAWLTYRLSAGITEFSAVVFFTADPAADDSSIRFLASSDGEHWTVLTDPSVSDAGPCYAFYRRIYKFYSLDPATQYVKILLPGNAGATPLISRVRVNDIDHSENLYEGRAAATFYVDAQNGNDANSGILPGEAFQTIGKINSKYFQPGDKILFKSGQSFHGQLTINGKGSKTAPVTVGTYGGEEKAKIVASVYSAITVIGEYITVENLEITNPTGTAGVYITASGAGKKGGVTVKNCYIHDIDVEEQQFAYQSGGIVVFCDGMDTAYFDGLCFENNVIENTSRTGIYVGTNWAARPGVGGNNNYVSDTEGWVPHTNCVIRGNEVTDARGDGIMAVGADRILIEKNTVNNAFCTQKQQGAACVGLWTTDTNDAVIQYNDVGHTCLPTGNADGDAFDIDIASVRTVVQYNYSHENASGFLLICNFGEGYRVSRDHTVRFNLSVNDVATAGQGVFILTGANPNTQIYNNTIYMGGSARSVQPVYHFGTQTANFTFTNNLFYGERTLRYSWGNTGENYAGFVYDRNVFVNVGTPANTGVSVSNAVYQNPVFANSSVSPGNPRGDVIAGFTPTRKIAGAAQIADHGGQDITGAAIGDNAFFGCVAH